MADPYSRLRSRKSRYLSFNGQKLGPPRGRQSMEQLIKMSGKRQRLGKESDQQSAAGHRQEITGNFKV